jgi:hypothetical protein
MEMVNMRYEYRMEYDFDKGGNPCCRGTSVRINQTQPKRAHCGFLIGT